MIDRERLRQIIVGWAGERYHDSVAPEAIPSSSVDDLVKLIDDVQQGDGHTGPLKYRPGDIMTMSRKELVETGLTGFPKDNRYISDKRLRQNVLQALGAR